MRSQAQSDGSLTAAPHLERVGSVPSELHEIPQWLVAQKDKAPRNLSGDLADATNPVNWLTFDIADAVVARGRFAYRGIALTPETGIVAIDLDDCVAEDGRLSDVAADAVRTLDSYTEFSASGRGLHIFVRAKKCVRACKNAEAGVEAYDRHFMLVTGNRLDGARETIENRQAKLDAFLAKCFPAKADPPAPRSTLHAAPASSWRRR